MLVEQFFGFFVRFRVFAYEMMTHVIFMSFDASAHQRTWLIIGRPRVRRAMIVDERIRAKCFSAVRTRVFEFLDVWRVRMCIPLMEM